MNYYQFALEADPETAEILTAYLSELPFDTFEETPTGVNAYLPEMDFSEKIEAELKSLQARFPFTFEKNWIAHQNWNAVWEANFEPVSVGSFCGVRADFHAPIAGVEHEIIINPKMAFGTGHHASTHMMIQMMERIDFRGKSVFDYGCGTGILAILADRLGAAKIDALDIEVESFENCQENCALNEARRVVAFHGTLENLPPATYDVILANINRNVILESLPSLSSRLNPGGVLVISGFLSADAIVIFEAIRPFGFEISHQLETANWLCQALTKGKS